MVVAIDEAHLIYDWQDFRESYKWCETGGDPEIWKRGEAFS